MEQTYTWASTDEPVGETYSYSTEQEPTILPSEIALPRARKFAFATGLGELDLQDKITRGQENDIRLAQAAQEDDNNRTNRLIQVARKVHQDGGSFDLELEKALKPTDPNTVIEKKIGDSYINEAFKNYNDVDNLSEAEKNYFRELQVKGSSLIARREVAQRYLEDIHAQNKQDSWPSFIANVVGPAIVPWAFSSYRLRNLMNEDKVESWLTPGQNLKQQYESYYLDADPDKAAERLREKVEELKKKNPLQAAEYLQGLVSFSEGSSAMATLGGALDVASIPGIAMATRAARNAVKTSLHYPPNSPQVAASLGNSERAAQLHARAAVQGGESSLQAMEDALPVLFNQDAIRKGASPFSPETAHRIVESLKDAEAKIMGTLDNLLGESRLVQPEARATAYEEAQDLASRQYSYSSDRVIAVRPLTSDETLTGDHIGIWLGNHKGLNFGSEIMAERVAREELKLADGSYRVVSPAPNEYAIEVVKPIDTRSIGVLNKLQVDTKELTPSVGAIGWLRSPEYQMNKGLMRDFKSNAVAVSKAITDFRQTMEPFKALSKEERSSLEQLVSWQNMKKGKDGRPGKSNGTLEEFTTDFFHVHGRSASDKEAEAYFHMVQLENVDYWLRNVNMKQAKEAHGLQAHELSFVLPNGQKLRQPVQFEGKFTTTPPWKENITKDDFWDLIVWNKNPDELSKLNNSATKFSKKETIDSLNDLVDNQGYKILHLSESGSRDLKDNWKLFYGVELKRHPTHLLVAPSELKSKPLPFQQIPYKEGFHRVYPDDGLILSQPKLSLYGERNMQYWRYDGDTSIHYIMPGSDANALKKSYEAAGQMVKDLLKMRKDAPDEYNQARKAADAYIKHNLPYGSLKEFEKQVKNGHIDLDQPFFARQVNGRIIDEFDIKPKDGRDFVDGIDNHFSIYRNSVDLTFAAKRNDELSAIANVGDKTNPVYKFVPTPQVPIHTVMDRALQRLVSQGGLEPLKVRAVTEWVSEFFPLLKEEYTRAQRDPMRTMIDFDYNQVFAKNNPELLRRAQIQRRQVLELLGMKSDFHRTTDAYVGQVVDGIFSERGLGKFNIEKPHALSTIDNPVKFFRNTAFNINMGLFNPIQFLVNMTTMININAVSTINHSVPATFGSFVSLALRFNAKPNMVEHADKIMRGFGWAKGDFSKAYRAMQDMGWNNVGREVSALGDYFDAPAIETTAGKFLDHSTIFFRRSERMLREAAWLTAWSEKRKELGIAHTMSKNDLKDILQRADILTVNMTSASNATWQRGLTGVPAQFMGYQTRLAEQMLQFGEKKALTASEKTRLLLAYSTILGIPAGGLGIVSGFAYPLHEPITRTLMEKGVDIDSNKVNRFLMSGLSDFALEWATDRRWNVSERYSPAGNSFFKDLIWPREGEGGVVKSAGGASLGTMWKLVSNGASLLKASLATIPGLPGVDEGHKIVEQDVLDFINSFGTGRAITKAYAAANLGAFLSTKGEKLTNATLTEGVYGALTGLVPIEVSRNRTILQSFKNRTDAIAELTKQYRQVILQAHREEDPKVQERLFKRATLLLASAGLTPQEQVNLWRRTTKPDEQLLLQNQFKFKMQSPERFTK